MNLLERIFAGKLEEVAAAKARAPLEELKERAIQAPAPRGFLRALAQAAQPVALIAEVKKASPSRGLIRPDFDPAAIAREYAAAGAHALSVLTDGPHFQGSLQNLKLARGAVDLPCLRKDFICDPYQIYEARAWGADAILLILAGLDGGWACQLQAVAEELDMDVLIEIHTEREAEFALEMGTDLVGVNNRNLADFQTSLEVSRTLIPLLLTGSPAPLVVSESAIGSFDDVDEVRQAGARAVLVGTTFCASPDIGAKVREVMGW